MPVKLIRTASTVSPASAAAPQAQPDSKRNTTAQRLMSEVTHRKLHQKYNTWRGPVWTHTNDPYKWRENLVTPVPTTKNK